MGIAKIALDPLPPRLSQTGKRGQKSAPNHPGKPLHPPPWPLRAMPLWKQHISKRGFPYRNDKKMSFLGQKNIDMA